MSIKEHMIWKWLIWDIGIFDPHSRPRKTISIFKLEQVSRLLCCGLK